MRLVFPDRDTLDLKIKRARPDRHTEENAGWRIVGKVALVNFVEGFEALRAYTEYVDLHDVLEVRSRRLKYRLQLFQDAFGLLLERRVDEKFSGLGSNGGKPEMKTMSPARVQVETGAPHFSKLLSNGSTRIISLFTISLLARFRWSVDAG